MKHKIKKIFENAIWWSGVVMIGLVLGASLQFVRTWTNPAVPPPAASSLSGNVALAQAAGGKGGCYVSYTEDCLSAEFEKVGTLGNWGTCFITTGAWYYAYFRPPSGECCAGGQIVTHTRGKAYLCCQK
jgi:hypothetical protein